MERCGVVGEANNLVAGYLAAVSHQLDAPLAILIQSTSAAGKAADGRRPWPWCRQKTNQQYQRHDGQSLFYLGETDMQHKIHAIAEEERVRSVPLIFPKRLQNMQARCKHRQRRRHRQTRDQAQYQVKGESCCTLTTTAIDVDRRADEPLFRSSPSMKPRTRPKPSHARQRTNRPWRAYWPPTTNNASPSCTRCPSACVKPVLVVQSLCRSTELCGDQSHPARSYEIFNPDPAPLPCCTSTSARSRRVILCAGNSCAYIEVSQAMLL